MSAPFHATRVPELSKHAGSDLSLFTAISGSEEVQVVTRHHLEKNMTEQPTPVLAPEPRRPVDSDDASVFETHARWVTEAEQVPSAAPETKSFSGSFLLYRKEGQKLRRPGACKVPAARRPRFRHPSFADAEAEAGRLLEHHPESTFIVLQEVARVKLKPVEQPVGMTKGGLQ